MGIFRSMFSRQDDELDEYEKEKLSNITSYNEQTVEKEHAEIVKKPTVVEFVSSLNSIVEINKVRNALDAREEQLTGKRPTVEDLGKKEDIEIHEEEVQKVPTPEFEVEEVEDIHKVEVSDEISTIEDTQIEVQEEDEYVELDTVKSENKPSFEVESGLFLKHVIEVFGEQNVFSIIEEKLGLDYLKGKPVLHIGIRNKDFFMQDVPVSEQNYWFVSFVKKVENLKNFKFIRSEEGMKDLVWERDEGFILISFKATQYLQSLDEFDFEL